MFKLKIIIVKKIVFVFLFIITMFSITKAQYYAGGSLGINFLNYKNDIDHNKRAFPNYKITPKIGYQYNDNLSFGLIFSYSNEKSYYYYSHEKSETEETFSLSEFGVFARQTIFVNNNFKLYIKSTLSAGFGGYKITEDAFSEKGESISTVSIDFLPCISYTVFDKIDIEIDFNMIHIGALFLNTESAPQTGVTPSVEKHKHFFFANNGCGHLPYNSNITLGATYRF